VNFSIALMSFAFLTGFDFPQMFELVDFFQLNSYDYIFHGLAIVGYCSPMSSLVKKKKLYLLLLEAKIDVFCLLK